jgi:HEAT repeat protein
MSAALLSTVGAGVVLLGGFALAPATTATAGDLPVAPSHAAPLATMRHEAVPSLIAQLDSPVPAARALVACALAERKADAAPATASLIALLDDDAPVSPYVCREEWWRNGDSGFAARWYDLRPTTPGQEAARALKAIGGTVFEPVLRVLPSGGNHARRNAAWILGALKDERAVPPLVTQLADPVAAVREHVAWALGAIDDARAVDALAPVVVQDDSADVRRQAAWALGAIRDAKAVDALARALRDKDYDVRRQAAWALGAIRDGRAVDPLIAALTDTQSDVRKQVAWALGAIGDARATDGLTAALDDADADVRRQAAWALGVVVRHRE